MTWWKRYLLYIVFSMVLLYMLLQFSLYTLIGAEYEYDHIKHGGEHLRDEFSHEKQKYTVKPAEVDSEKEGFDESLFYYDFKVDRVVVNIKNRTEYALENKLPILMWWTHFTGDKGVVKRCNLGECYFTDVRKYQHHPLTKVFLFYGTDLHSNDLPLPRKSHHEWALFHEESPKNSFLYSFPDVMTLFNHTSTFKQESDYPIPTQYLESLENLLAPPVYTFEQKEALGLAPVAYVQSGCNPPSDRDAYINELMKYIKVDSYGKCMHNKDPDAGLDDPLKMHEKSHRDFLAKYKFVLSFENALCKDYMTEKLWNPLYGGAVPIYKGAPNVQEWMPNNHSIILADDFQNPKELAEFIRKIANDKAAYEKYLEFKKEGVTNSKLLDHMKSRPWAVNDDNKMGFITGFECFVCDRVHENRKLANSSMPAKEHVAALEHYGCPPPKLYPYVSPPETHDYERTSWEDEYKDAKGKAYDFRRLVQGH